MSTPLLQITNLSIDFTADGITTNAVKNNSFTIEKGEMVAIVGESGSGKSATALSLMKLLPATASVKGEMLFSINNYPIDILQLSDKEINKIRGKDIAMIFQEPMTSLNPVFTCGNQVMEAIQLHEKSSATIAKEKTITLFEKVKLPNPSTIFDRYPHQLSGGQKQRIMIAMAMSCNPSLLIADEPTTALDVTVQKTIIELIKDLQQQNNMGVVFISHDINLVADIADKILVMYKGEIIEQGKIKDILRNPQHAYTQALLACRPTKHLKGQRLPIVSDFFSDGNFVEKINSVPNISAISNQESEIYPVLSVKDLSVHFSEKKKIFAKQKEAFKAVDNVSFDVFKGETIGLVGESGCGKTTLGRAILQLIPVTSGNIILDGSDLARLSKKEMRPLRKELQIIFQDPYGALNPRLTIGNAIKEPMKVHQLFSNDKKQNDKVIELLEKVNLKAEHFNRYPHQFSGGQRQRICIARALALNPSFLIFDESVSALDVSIQAQVLNLLNDLKEEFGFTSIFISHDLAVVHYISDRILVMNKGKIIEEGKADDVFFSPKNEYTKKLIAAIPGSEY